MNVLVIGHHPADETFIVPLKTAGVGIARWDGQLPAPRKPSGDNDYDWLVLLNPASANEQTQVRVLRERGIKAPTIRIDLEVEQTLNLFRPVLVGAVERKRNGEKILNCNLSAGSAPHPAKSNPFGEIIYEYHAPCKA